MTHSYYLLLRPSKATATGEMAHQITGEEGRKMVADGSAVMLEDGVLREVQGGGKKPEYARKDMVAEKAGKDMVAEKPDDKGDDDSVSAKKKSSDTKKKA